MSRRRDQSRLTAAVAAKASSSATTTIPSASSSQRPEGESSAVGATTENRPLARHRAGPLAVLAGRGA